MGEVEQVCIRMCMHVCVQGRESEEEIKINEPAWRVVIATGLHLTTDYWGNDTRDEGSDRDKQWERQSDSESQEILS